MVGGQHKELPRFYSNEHPLHSNWSLSCLSNSNTCERWRGWRNERLEQWDLKEQRLSRLCWWTASTLPERRDSQQTCLVQWEASDTSTHGWKRTREGCHHFLIQSPPIQAVKGWLCLPQHTHRWQHTCTHTHTHVRAATNNTSLHRHIRLRATGRQMLPDSLHRPTDVQIEWAVNPLHHCHGLAGARPVIDRFKQNNLCLLDQRAGGRRRVMLPLGNGTECIAFAFYSSRSIDDLSKWLIWS